MSPRSAPNVLHLEQVTRSFRIGLGFRSRQVLRGIDLSLERGRSLGLVGPNGSGKSTLLRLCAGVDRPSSGTIEVLGGNPLSQRVRERLAYLPEDSPFPTELSALGVMELLGSLHGLRRRELRPRATSLLERVGLGEQHRTPLRSYSRGMLRRFGLAQTFLTEPDLVLLDEPTAGLDATGFGVLEDLLADARARQATVVLCSHLLSDVHDHCDRLAVLLDGKLAASGTPAELFGVTGRMRLEVEGLDDAQLTRLGEWAQQHGGRVLSARPAGRTLLELYRAHGASTGG